MALFEPFDLNLGLINKRSYKSGTSKGAIGKVGTEMSVISVSVIR